MDTRLSLSGFAHDSTAALFHAGRVAVCSEGRARRVRRVGVERGGWPEAAVAALRQELGVARLPSEWFTAETGIHQAFPDGTLVPHHFAHARTAFLASGFERSLVLVCDASEPDPETLWLGDGAGLHQLPLVSRHRSIARRLSSDAGASGHGRGAAREIELLARHGDTGAERMLSRFAGELLTLLESIASSESAFRALPICLGGGLFYNGYFNLRLRESGVYDSVFVPPDPGNSGLSVGCALPGRAPGEPLSAFLGPQFDDEAVKAVLDNCKLTYRFVSDAARTALACDHLRRGRLVGWFVGPMEWGPRALGNRSILASPFSKYASTNLNQYLKHRPAHHTYSVSVLEDDAASLFQTAVTSPFMEAEGELGADAGRLSAVAGTAKRLRMQTVSRGAGPFADLLQAFGAEEGAGVLINTSFNGFHEPIVVTPRDAVRVFFGTGLDAMAIGHFWLEK
jgi:predicted NodU family carbamoyl transferase